DIFERVTNDYEGTGIGLSIVKKGIERMGGKVGVESTLGKGSTFWFEWNAAHPLRGRRRKRRFFDETRLPGGRVRESTGGGAQRRRGHQLSGGRRLLRQS